MFTGKHHSHWSDFELVTKVGLKALGYTVSRDLLMAGSQVDLYAESRHYLHVHRLIVECKDYHNEVGIEVVRQCAAVVDSVSTKETPVNGMIVARNGFTKTAKAFSKKANIALLDIDELLRLSFDPFSVLPHLLAIYEGDALSKVYVDLSCTVLEKGGGSIYKPVERFLDSFFGTTKRGGVAILGNFGSGKTSLCKHYAHILAQRFSEKTGNVLPIYVNLRDFTNVLNLENDILELLLTVYRANITPQGWRYWLLNRPTLLILDGFDEMASKMDKIEIQRNALKLAEITQVTQAKLIVTCRTHFFKSDVHEASLGNLLRLYIRDWGSDELREYVAKSLPHEAESSLHIIRSTYNLEELSRTPIFLNMITATIGDVRGVVNPAKLYQVYTDRWIEEQDYRSKLAPTDKAMFMQELAFEMFSSERSRIPHGMLPIRIRELFSVQENDALASLDRDIRTCSFLIRDASGHYYFVHKSYMEFFVALKLAEEVKSQRHANFGKRELSIEIAGFLANFFEGEYEALIRLLLGSEDPIVRGNAAIVLGCFPQNEPILAALSLAISTDRDVYVRRRAADSIAAFGSSAAVQKLISLSSEEGEFGIYCIRCLSSYMDRTEVVELCRSVLSGNEEIQRIQAVLEIIAGSRTQTLIPEVRTIYSSNVWATNWVLTRTLIMVIQALADLDLALQLENIERSRIVDSELAKMIEVARHELVGKFRSDVETEAVKNHVAGLSHRANASAIRKRFRFLIDDTHLTGLLEALYPRVAGGTHRRSR